VGLQTLWHSSFPFSTNQVGNCKALNKEFHGDWFAGVLGRGVVKLLLTLAVRYFRHNVFLHASMQLVQTYKFVVNSRVSSLKKPNLPTTLVNFVFSIP
jgi:hypothetical protein